MKRPEFPNADNYPYKRFREDNNRESCYEIPKKTFAEEQLERMGYRPGEGLGAQSQGIVDPVVLTSQLGKRGLGYGDLRGDLNATFEQESVVQSETISWIPSNTVYKFSDVDFDRWLEYGPYSKRIDDQTEFCNPFLLPQLLQCKSNLDELESKDVRKARSRANPYELLKSAIFMNRAALKLANIDFVTDYMVSSPFGISDKKLLYFADICAGPGGFSEYILWKRGWRAKGFGLTLRETDDGTDFQLDKFLQANAPQCFEPHYGVGGLDGDGDITNSANMEAFRSHVLDHSDGVGVHIVTADGGFSVEGDENSQEILSKQLLLCQATLAMSILQPNGNFVVKTFDNFTPFTASVLYLLRFAFSEVAIFKPITSRPANSERYFVCKGYNPTPGDNIWKVFDAINRQINEDLWPNDKDVITMVPISVMKQDIEFYNYLCESNNSIMKTQMDSLKKVVQFVKNPTLTETRQSDLRSNFLKLWKIPDGMRRKPQNCEPQIRFKILIGNPRNFNPAILNHNNLSKLLPTYRDVKFCFMSAPVNESVLLFGCGGGWAYKSSDGIKWARVDSKYKIDLPRDTVLEVEFIQEYFGDGLAQSARYRIHVIDALVLAGENIIDKTFNDRCSLTETFLHAIDRSATRSTSRIRMKEYHRLETLKDKFEGIKSHMMKSREIKQVYFVNDSSAQRPYCQFSGISFVCVLQKPWILGLSSQKKFYFYNSLTKESVFEPPKDSVASYWHCASQRLRWVYEQSVQLSDHEFSPKFLCRSDLINHVASLRSN